MRINQEPVKKLHEGPLPPNMLVDFSLAHSHGLDIAIMKAIFECQYRFMLFHKEMYVDSFVTLDGLYWLKISMDIVLFLAPLWERNHAIAIFNSLVNDKHVTVMGKIEEGEILFCLRGEKI